MNTEGLHVAVAGAGIGGTAVALLLSRAGCRVTLLERVAEPREAGAGLLLQPNGIAVLQGLGLGDQMANTGMVARKARLADGRGHIIADTPVPDYGEGLDHLLVVRRSDLLAALLDAVAAEAHVERRFGAEVTAATPAGDVAFGDDGRMSADLVVAADGVHSRVRDGGEFGAKLRPGITYMRGLAEGPPLVETLTEYWTSYGIFGAAPVRDGTYFYASVSAPAVAAALEAHDAPALRDAWYAATPVAGEILRSLESTDALLLNRVTRVDCSRWADGRIALLGDAAHAMAPNLGQGANSALVDAAVLVHELTVGADLPSALAAYEARRRPAVRRVQAFAGRAGAAAEMTNAVARKVRDTGARLILNIASARSARMMQQEDPAQLRSLVYDVAAGRSDE